VIHLPAANNGGNLNRTFVKNGRSQSACQVARVSNKQDFTTSGAQQAKTRLFSRIIAFR
jgi:hypothetical protein